MTLYHSRPYCIQEKVAHLETINVSVGFSVDETLCLTQAIQHTSKYGEVFPAEIFKQPPRVFFYVRLLSSDPITRVLGLEKRCS